MFHSWEDLTPLSIEMPLARLVEWEPTGQHCALASDRSLEVLSLSQGALCHGTCHAFSFCMYVFKEPFGCKSLSQSKSCPCSGCLAHSSSQLNPA